MLSSVQASSYSLKAASRPNPCLSTFSQAQARAHLILHDWGSGLNPQVPKLGTSLGMGSCPDSPPPMSSPTIHSQGREGKGTQIPKPIQWPQLVSLTSAICIVSSSICQPGGGGNT